MATLPQLEYPRREPLPWARVTGPLLWEQPFGDVELPPGDDPLVLVAPSTSQDPDQTLAARGARGPRRRAGARAGDDQPPAAASAAARAGRTPASSTGSPTRARCRAATRWSATPATARWRGRWSAACRSSPARTPGDMAENAARVRWAGLGVSLPRRFQTRPRRAAGAAAAAGRPGATRRARPRSGAGPRRNDGAATAADAVEAPRRAARPPTRRAEAMTKLRGWDSNPQPFG